ncbi:MAG TPA: SDR family oxidoreductase [Clostridiales bacterium]|nr:SDR family oxidoreductase [Clostridiales bacterium]
MDKKIVVVTGAARGMGFAAAKKLAEKYHVILTDVNQENLDQAVADLKKQGYSCEGRIVDVSDRAAVEEVARYAAGLGEVQAAVNIAGLSPSMTNAEKIWTVNAMGTIYMDKAFAKVMKSGACICNFSSMSGDMLPDLQLMRSIHNIAGRDPERYQRIMLSVVSKLPGALGSSMAYMLSKNFVNYYAKLFSRELVDTGIRVVTISPGDFATPMGMLEKDGAATYIPNSSIRRFGEPEEMAFLVDAVVDERNSYLTGCEILNDGGVIASLQTSFPYFLKATVMAAVNQFHLKEKLPFLR